MDNKDILEEMNKSLSSVIGLSNQLMKNLPLEVVQQIPMAQADVNKIFNGLKSGDYSTIIDIQRKYADNNSK